GLSTEQEHLAETTLAGWARVHDPVTVGRLGRHLIHALDTDTLEDREQRAYQRRELRLAEVGDGSTRLSGRLDAESRGHGPRRPGPAGRPLPRRGRHPRPAYRGAAQCRRPGWVDPDQTPRRNRRPRYEQHNPAP
ncbi:MAG TPA: hypothetical protein VFH02_03460, partial [Jiangellaceae bacterium]|nr:hypothetical protein [Jiangellaceae bacterium]